jgi:hypothetical protein
MTRRGKVITITVSLAALALLGVGVAAADDRRKPRDRPKNCPAGMKWSARLGRCVPVECPAGFEREGGRIDSDCVAIDDPEVKFCPVGMHWDVELGECVEDDPTECPPDQVYDLITKTCRLKDPTVPPPSTDCPEGFHFVPAPFGPGGSCIPDDPTAPECPEGFHWQPAPFGEGGSCIPDVDPGDFADYLKNYPTDGAFYQVKAGDFPGWATSGMQTKSVVQNMFGSALMLAAREYGGLSPEAALAWANTRRKSTAATNMLLNAVWCSAWNDMLYGTYGYQSQGVSRNHPGKHGRAIRFLKQHANNVLRLEQGLRPARTVGMGSPQTAGNAGSVAQGSASPGGKTSYPLLWLPGLDRERLWQSDGQDIRFDPDKALPPDFIWDRGIENLSDANLQAYGCDDDESGYRGRVVV